MVKRRYSSKRTYRRPYRRVRRKIYKYIPRSLKRNFLQVKRKFYHFSWVWNTTTTNDFWKYFIFRPIDIPNWQEYSSLFDEFKICALKYTFMPRYDNVDQSQVQAYMHYHIDPGSTQIPSGVYGQTTLNSFMENSGVKTRVLNRPFSVYYKPKTVSLEFGGSTQGKLNYSSWHRVTNNSVDYRGFHAFVNLNNFTSTNANIVLDVYITVYLQLKNMK